MFLWSVKIPERPFFLFFRDNQENYAKTVRRWREDLFLGDHLKFHAKTTTGGATPSEFYVDQVNFGPF